MSTTTDALLRWTARAGLVLLAWFAILLVLPFLGSGRDLAVVGARGPAIATIAAAGGRVVEVRRGAVIARGDRAGFAARLYSHGARLVLEGRIGAGCFPRIS
jgi:hypothetical protein